MTLHGLGNAGEEKIINKGSAFNSPTSLPTDRALTLDGWVDLNPGDRITIRTSAKLVAAGTVDIVAFDASIFWIWLDEGRGRIAIHEHDETDIWRIG